MKKKKQVPDEKENGMDAFEDTHVYAAGSEADENFSNEELAGHTNGGIPDDEDDLDDDDDDLDDDRA